MLHTHTHAGGECDECTSFALLEIIYQLGEFPWDGPPGILELPNPKPLVFLSRCFSRERVKHHSPAAKLASDISL